MAVSVISSGSCTPSILKVAGNRSRAVQQRVRFQLPNDLRAILLDFINEKSLKPYEELVCILKDSEIQDEDLCELLRKSRDCISLLKQDLRHFVEAILNLKWVHRTDKAVREFQGFVLDLLSAHTYYTKYALDKLVTSFKPDDDSEWVNGIPPEKDKRSFMKIHDLISVILQVIPMSSALLVKTIRHHFPYLKRSAHEHECYIYNILKVFDYQPDLRTDLLLLIASRLTILDVNAPKAAIEELEEENELEIDMDDQDVFAMDDSESHEDHMAIKPRSPHRMKHPVANTLDIIMERLFQYMHTECHELKDPTLLNWERTKKLYHEMLTVFDKMILPTYACHHIQFLMFYLCSFKQPLAESFLNYLWQKVCSPNVAPVIRQTAVLYISSLLARATYIPVSVLKNRISDMAVWIHNYISSQDGLESMNSDVRVHTVFYAICQAFFYIIAFRHKDLVNTKSNLVFLQSLNLTKIVTCRLNPLKVCLPAVVQNFAAVTRAYQLAYCYTIIEHNTRNTMPVAQQDGHIVKDKSELVLLNTFFPFDPYILYRSGCAITPIYREYQGSVSSEDSYDMSHEDKHLDEFEEDDDFLSGSSFVPSPVTYPELFSYGSSPGFKHM